MTAPIHVLDGHNDTLLQLAIEDPGSEESFFQGREGGHLDLPRARAGGLAGGMFAMFAPTKGWKKQIRWRRSRQFGTPVAGEGVGPPRSSRRRPRRCSRE